LSKLAFPLLRNIKTLLDGDVGQNQSDVFFDDESVFVEIIPRHIIDFTGMTYMSNVSLSFVSKFE
jgi:hypothetical protein